MPESPQFASNRRVRAALEPVTPAARPTKRGSATTPRAALRPIDENRPRVAPGTAGKKSYQPARLTQPKPFTLASDMRAELRHDAVAPAGAHAAQLPVPEQWAFGAAPLVMPPNGGASRGAKKLTEPTTPAFHTSARTRVGRAF